MVGIGEHVANAQAIDVEVTAPATAHVSPFETGNWLLISIMLFFLLDGRDFLKCIDQS